MDCLETFLLWLPDEEGRGAGVFDLGDAAVDVDKGVLLPKEPIVGTTPDFLLAFFEVTCGGSSSSKLD